MAMKMNFIDLKLQYENMKVEMQEAINKVLESTQFILGPDVSALEKEIATFCSTKHAIGVASGTDALLVPLMAMGIGPGDEVITTPFTFIATAEVISLLGATPVFIDINEKTYNLDTSQLESKITKKTKAVIPVHLYGQCADMDELLAITQRHGIAVIEDACQAIGAEYKGKKACSMGKASALSFFPSKNLGCYGDAGMILSNDEDFALKMRQIANHGQDVKYSHKYIGINGRMDTIQAAILRVKLKYLNEELKSRERLAEAYIDKLKDVVTVPYKEDYNRHVYNQFTIRTTQRDELCRFLNDHGIPTAIHYPIALHMQECFKYLGYKKGSFPIAEKSTTEVMSLPMFPLMTEEQQTEVIHQIRKFFGKA